MRLGGQTLLSKGFTLIELLAVIVILAIIVLIAVPQILNLINNSKDKSSEISVKNYLKAVELAVMNEDISSNKNLAKRIEFEIIDGKKIYSNNNTEDTSDDITIDVEYDENGLTDGTIVLENYKVIKTFNTILEDGVFVFVGSDGKIETKEKTGISTLVSGGTFNVRIKNLANNIGENDTQMTTESEDMMIQSIEFYSFGELPKGYTKEELKELPSVDMSDGKDGSIIAYNDNGKVYVLSENLINFNSYCNNMFYKLKSILTIKFGYTNTRNMKSMSRMFRDSNKLNEVDVNNWDTSEVTSMKEVFSGCNGLTNLDVSNWNTSNVTSMYNTFAGCSSLTELDVSHFDTSKVTTMQGMFSGCGLLTELDVSKFNTSQVTNLFMTFNKCSSVKELDVSKWDTSKVTSLYRTFDSCSSLTELDVSNWNTECVTDMYAMFQGCSGLTRLDFRNWDTTQVMNMVYMFRWCYKLKPIYVGEKWYIPETASGMFISCATKNAEQLCYPDSTHSWCVIN